MTAPTSITRRISDLMACLARCPEWSTFSESLGRLWSMVGALIAENNALRKNNERLADDARRLGREAAELRKQVAMLSRHAGDAEMLALHWRLKAEPESANYDAMREDSASAPTLPGTHGHNWDADGREVAS